MDSHCISICDYLRLGQDTSRNKKRPNLMMVKAEEDSEDDEACSTPTSIAELMGLNKDMMHADVEPVGEQGYRSMQARRKTAAEAAKPAKAKAKAKSAGRKKGSFRRLLGWRKKKKAGKKKAAKKDTPAKCMFQSYNLLKLEVPKEAWPQGPSKGLHSYTLKKGDAAIEVLCRNRALYCKKIHPTIQHDPEHKVGQVGWKTVGSVAAAWRVAKERVGWDLE